MTQLLPDQIQVIRGDCPDNFADRDPADWASRESGETTLTTMVPIVALNPVFRIGVLKTNGTFRHLANFLEVFAGFHIVVNVLVFFHWFQFSQLLHCFYVTKCIFDLDCRLMMMAKIKEDKMCKLITLLLQMGRRLINCSNKLIEIVEILILSERLIWYLQLLCG